MTGFSQIYWYKMEQTELFEYRLESRDNIADPGAEPNAATLPYLNNIYLLYNDIVWEMDFVPTEGAIHTIMYLGSNADPVARWWTPASAFMSGMVKTELRKRLGLEVGR